MPNNPDAVLILINLYPKQFIIATANNPPTMDAPAFADQMGEFFRGS
jgi:hypothetical protein